VSVNIFRSLAFIMNNAVIYLGLFCICVKFSAGSLIVESSITAPPNMFILGSFTARHVLLLL
jgi:hypothetical protein